MIMRNRLCVSQKKELRKMILEETYSAPDALHPDNVKMYRTLIEHYWWQGMKRDIVEFVSRCLVCQQIKAEHQKPSRKLNPLLIPQWKWEDIAMDFISKLPRMQSSYDSIWVIVDRLTKSAHFLLVKKTYSLEKLTKLYVQDIVRLHGAPV